MRDIVLQAPAKNALNLELIRSLNKQLKEARGEPLLLKGSGDSFSAGLNLKEVAALDENSVVPFIRELDEMFESLYFYPGPTVACINGHAIAGGAILALCCDHRVCAPNPSIKLGITEVAVGVRFPPIALRIVRFRVPTHSIHRIMLGGFLYPPNEALSLGLIDEIADDTETVARQRLAEFSRHSPRAYASTKEELRGKRPPAEELEAEMADLLPTWTSPELKASLAARWKK